MELPRVLSVQYEMRGDIRKFCTEQVMSQVLCIMHQAGNSSLPIHDTLLALSSTNEVYEFRTSTK